MKYLKLQNDFDETPKVNSYLKTLKLVKKVLTDAKQTNTEEVFICDVCNFTKTMNWVAGMQDYYLAIHPDVKLVWCCSDSCKTAFLLQQEIYVETISKAEEAK